jgi:putative pantetheine hydrolase
VPASPAADGPRAGAHNDLTDVDGVLVGHHHRRGRGWLSGTTVVIPPSGTVGSVDVRGGGPATRETDALAPTALVATVDAVCLSGGSAYGLAAADGVMRWLAARGIGFPVGASPFEVVPIVAAAALFDLRAGGVFANRPDATWGEAASDAATRRRIRQGCVGAGTGARSGMRTGSPLKGGLGSASVVLPGGITVAALVAVNPGGSVVDPATGELYGARFALPGEFAGRKRPDAIDLPVGGAPHGVEQGEETWPARQTVLAVVATDARLSKGECNRLAAAGHDGMARAIRPIHGMADGDVVFSLATGRRELFADPDLRPAAHPPAGLTPGGPSRAGHVSDLMAAAADTVTRAIVHGVLAATTMGGLPAYLDRYPSARPS